MQTHYLTPEGDGTRTLTVLNDTRYFYVARCWPDIEITALGADQPLLYCQAGNQAVMGLSDTGGGFSLPSKFTVRWIDSGRDAGETMSDNYGALIYSSNMPIRLEGSSKGIRGTTQVMESAEEGEARSAALMPRLGQRNQGGLIVAPVPALTRQLFTSQASPTWALGAGVYEAVSGLGDLELAVLEPGEAYADSGVWAGSTNVTRVVSVRLQVRAVTGAPVEVILWRIPNSYGVTPTSPGEDFGLAQELTVQGVRDRVITRPNTPTYSGAGIEPIIGRVLIMSQGQEVELIPPNSNGAYLTRSYPGLALAVRSSAGGTLAVYSNWTWEEGAAGWLP